MLASSHLDAFEREWNYDISYARQILDRGIDAFQAFAGVQVLGEWNRGIPAAPLFAARIVSVRAGDCGPCLQLTVSMAERSGVDPDILRMLLAGERDRLPGDVRLAAAYTDAVLAHAAEAAELRESVLAAWGEDGLVSLAFSITAGQMYPTLKYALGHGHACVRVRVGGAETAVHALAS